MRRRAWIGMAVIAALAIGITTQRRAIGEAMFARGVEQRMAANRVAELEPGLHLYLCGTGSPLPDPDRAGPCAAVIAGDRVLLFDSGDGSSRRLAAGGFSAGQVERLFLTHFHSDHIDGLGAMMLLHWTQGGGASPMPVHGPEGVAAVVDGFNAAYRADVGYRVAHHGAAVVPPGGAGGTAMPFSVPADGSMVTVINDRGLIVRAFAVDHRPVMPAVGYRIDYAGRSIVISGDSAATPSIARAALGADILVHEALQPRLVAVMAETARRRGDRRLAAILGDIPDYHASPEDAARTAHDARVGQLVLTHIVPPVPGRWFDAAFLGDAAEFYDGPIAVGRDGDLFSLPARRR